MEAIIKLRNHSAFFSPSKILYADNENLEITVRDRGQIINSGYLIFNSKMYLITDYRCVIPHDEISVVNTCELQDREGDKILTKWRVENLYCYEFSKEIGREARLLAEREFYSVTAKKMANEILELQTKVERLEKIVSGLENGKFRLMKFKTEEKEI